MARWSSQSVAPPFVSAHSLATLPHSGVRLLHASSTRPEAAPRTRTPWPGMWFLVHCPAPRHERRPTLVACGPSSVVPTLPTGAAFSWDGLETTVLWETGPVYCLCTTMTSRHDNKTSPYKLAQRMCRSEPARRKRVGTHDIACFEIVLSRFELELKRIHRTFQKWRVMRFSERRHPFSNK